MQLIMKMRHAALLLASTTMPVSTIGEILGYSEPGKFQKAFRAIYKISPMIYRMRHNGAISTGVESRTA